MPGVQWICTTENARWPFPPKVPLTPGYAAVGVVDELATGVATSAVGDSVAALTVYSGYVEVVVVESGLAKFPRCGKFANRRSNRMTNRSLSFLAVVVLLLLAACAAPAPAPSPQAERTDRSLVTVYRSPT